MPKEITNIHDKFFKKIISDKSVAIGFFDTFLPIETRKKLNLDTVEYLDTSYIDDKLEVSFADALFSCETYDGRSAKIVILIEHKSYVDKYTPIQTLYYIANGMMQQIIRKEELKVIIPIVFYHGKQKWEYVNLTELLDINFAEYIPSFKTIFVDLYRIPDQSLEMITNAFLSSILLTQKYSREPKKLVEKLEAIFNTLDPGRRNLFRPLTVYFIHLVTLEKNVIFEKISTLESDIKKEIMSTYDLILKQGIEQGIGKGIEQEKINTIIKGHEKGLSFDILSSLTGFSIEEITVIIENKK